MNGKVELKSPNNAQGVKDMTGRENE